MIKETGILQCPKTLIGVIKVIAKILNCHISNWSESVGKYLWHQFG